jgi:hypothetical protein
MTRLPLSQFRHSLAVHNYRTTAVLLLLVLALFFSVGAAQSSAIPTFSILSATADDSVTIQPFNFPPNQTFTVTMGAMGTRGIGGIVVDTVTTDAAGQLSKTTYPIPAALHGSYQVAIRLQTGHANPYFAYNWFFNSTAPGGPTGGIPGYAGFPTFRIVAVERDVNVAIGPNNFPPNQTFTVTMGAMGTRGIGGIVVDTVTTDAAGALSKVIFTIPDALKGSYQVAIRLSTAHANPYFAYNWFFNNTTGPGGGMGIPGYGGYPTFSITAVTRDADVTIGPNNFPPNQSFTVTMGAMGTRGIGGIVVDTVTTDAAGALSKTTFTTPAALYGSYQIAIRLQQVNGPYFAYNWFYNNTAPAPATGAAPVVPTTPGPTGGLPVTAGYVGIPTFKVCSVVQNQTVTIAPTNFPANQTFSVTMGPMFTRGIGGTVVDTVTTDANGVLSNVTYNIPAALQNSYRIAIRLQTGHANPYFAYNWFYNNTADVCP